MEDLNEDNNTKISGENDFKMNYESISEASITFPNWLETIL